MLSKGFQGLLPSAGSTIALHCINGGGEYRQFVANRVRKIKEHSMNKWRRAPTEDNPADLGNRDGFVKDSESWWSGPAWLANHDQWPPNLVTKETAESAAEAKIIKEVVAA